MTRRFHLGRLTAALLLPAAGACAAGAAVVTERWGVSGHVQHPRTLVFEALPDGSALMRFDLSALPAKARVHRARLVLFRREEGFATGFAIVPAERVGQGAGDVRVTGRGVQLVGPWHRWFDATDPVRKWAATTGRTGMLLLRKAPPLRPAGGYLEIAYEGRLRVRCRQVSGVRAFCRSGQVFVTFKEVEDLAAGRKDLSWQEFSRKVKGWGMDGPVPDDGRRELRYRIYRHDAPITSGNIGGARLVGELASGSGYNTHLVPRGWNGKKAPPVLRVAVQPGRPLPPGVGVHVHAVRRNGRGFYAVVAAVDGVENTIDISRGNSVGPVAEKRAAPEPVLEREIVHDMKGAKFVTRWYSYWADPPLAPRPLRYDVAVAFCPELLSNPAPLTVIRGHAWESRPDPPAPHKTAGIYLSHSSEWPNAFWMGINDACGTLKGIEQGRWQPFPMRRQEALVRWAQRQWRIDGSRIVAAIGAWGMMEIERPEMYSTLVGWGLPEVTKGFQVWDRAVGGWGPPKLYAGRPPAENPYLRQDYSRYVLANPEKELPYFALQAGWGMHLREMGWPPFPRFLRAMTRTKRAFVAGWDQRSSWSWRATPVHRAVARGQIDIRTGRSLPAFGKCSLDDNPGSGRLGTGDLNGQINGYLLWESESILDQASRWAGTVWLDETAPRGDCTADLTPRRCRRFKAKPGERFPWTNTLLPAPLRPPGPADKSPAQPKIPAVPRELVVQRGTAAADAHGLVTVEGLVIGKAKQRISIVRLPRGKGK